MPKATIITAAHIDTLDKQNWLDEAVNSVLTQDFSDLEMIIVDDASPLSVKQFEDKRVRVFRSPEKQGPALCRNTGVALAQSEAIYVLDADDILPEGALFDMYTEWEKDKKKIIYGNLQRLELVGGQWTKGKIFDMPKYTFAGVMNLEGIIPVSALHSIECHNKAGGWDAQFVDGLEDVSYWIAAGKAGFCGEKINRVTLIYRRHNTSRAYAMRQINRKYSDMRNLVMQVHNDVYEGRFPMGCCGGGSSYIPPKNNNVNQMKFATLDQYPVNQTTWVEYKGNRNANFGVMGDQSGIRYNIEGKGFRFQVFNGDLNKFRRLGRGADFNVGVAPPEIISHPEQLKETHEFKANPPQLAAIERLDNIAIQRGQAVV